MSTLERDCEILEDKKVDKNLRKMKKRELLELLLAQEKEIERLKDENIRLRKHLKAQKIRIENTGSIAEAAMELSGIFEAAQHAADLYLENVKVMSKRKEISDISSHEE